jgi:hypothetical protein
MDKGASEGWNARSPRIGTFMQTPNDVLHALVDAATGGDREALLMLAWMVEHLKRRSATAGG